MPLGDVGAEVDSVEGAAVDKAINREERCQVGRYCAADARQLKRRTESPIALDWMVK